MSPSIAAQLGVSLFALAACALPSPVDRLDKRQSTVVTGANAVVTSSAGLAWYSSSLTAGTQGVQPNNNYTCFSGPASNFPPMSRWVNFNTMFSNAITYSLKPVNDSSSEIGYIHDAIIAISQAAKVDARAVLATILLESSGNVRVGCTTSPGGVNNCGLMQSYDARKTSFNPKQPKKSITQQIRNGVQGTPAGPGQVQHFNDASDTNAETGGNAYAVFREYNSGSVDPTNLSNGLGATDAYVSNMANYLMGWNGYGNGPAGCKFTSSTATKPPGPTQAGVAANCNKWLLQKDGVYCQDMANQAGITLQRFYQLNPAVGSSCQNLWSGYAYCVGTTS